MTDHDDALTSPQGKTLELLISNLSLENADRLAAYAKSLGLSGWEIVYVVPYGIRGPVRIRTKGTKKQAPLSKVARHTSKGKA